jgi:hypothetical protein
MEDLRRIVRVFKQLTHGAPGSQRLDTLSRQQGFDAPHVFLSVLTGITILSVKSKLSREPSSNTDSSPSCNNNKKDSCDERSQQRIGQLSYSVLISSATGTLSGQNRGVRIETGM